MSNQTEHGTQVDVRLARHAPPTMSTERLIELLAEGFDALWNRAWLTLGDVTLTAIGERVLLRCAERQPVLAGLTVGPTGLNCEALGRGRAPIEVTELRDGIRSVLVEFLTIVCRLTAGVLTPALYSVLARTATGVIV